MATVSTQLTARIRSDQGKGASRRLRRIQNQVPAILYGAAKPAVPLVLDHHHVLHALANESFYTRILTLQVENHENEKVVLKAVQRHPCKPRVLHLDFMRVSKTEKLRMTVPLHFVGIETAACIQQGAVLTQHVHQVEISCFPDDLPEFIEVDVQNIQLNDILHLSDLVLPKGVTIVQLSHGEEYNVPVISAHLPRVQEEITAEAPVAPVEVEATQQKTKEELEAKDKEKEAKTKKPKE